MVGINLNPQARRLQIPQVEDIKKTRDVKDEVDPVQVLIDQFQNGNITFEEFISTLKDKYGVHDIQETFNLMTKAKQGWKRFTFEYQGKRYTFISQEDPGDNTDNNQFGYANAK